MGCGDGETDDPVPMVTDDEAEVEIAQGIRVRVVKGTLSQVLTKSAKPAND